MEKSKESQMDATDDVIFEDDDDDDVNSCGGCFIVDQLTGCRSAMLEFSIRHRFYIRVGLLVLLVLLYFVYFAYALSYHFGDEGSIRLLWITCLVVVILALKLLLRCLRPQLESLSKLRLIRCIRQHHSRINWFAAVLFTC